MSSFFSCFSCGDSNSTAVGPEPILISPIKPVAEQQSNNINFVSEWEDDKSRSNTTITFRTTDTSPSQEDENSYIRKKIQQIRKKDLPERKAMQSQFIKQNLNKSAVIYLVQKQWSQQYTNFLKNIDQKQIRTINNLKLLDEKNNLKNDLRQREDYFIINQRVWKFVQQMYGGGPAIAKDQYFPVYLLAIKKHELNLVGMINPQYLCYMISVIQCLLSIQQLSFYFFKRQYEESKKKSQIHYLMHKLVKNITEATESKIDIKQFSSIFESRFSAFEQHDAHQFFLYLVNLIQEEVKQEIPIKTQPIVDAETAYTYYFKNNRSIFDRVFAGQIKTVVTCTRCETASTNYIPFLDLQLEIVDSLLQNCLKKHFSTQKLDDLYDCQKCQKKTKAFKQYAISKTPNVLLIVLKKFNQNGKKIEDRVKYPFELDIKKFCNGHYGYSKYVLQSIIVHKGTRSTKGHYYCYTKRTKKSWHYANDDVIKQIEANQSLGRDAYMLFYERLK